MKKKENGHCFEEVYLLEKLNLTDSNAIKVIPQCYLIYITFLIPYSRIFMKLNSYNDTNSRFRRQYLIILFEQTSYVRPYRHLLVQIQQWKDQNNDAILMFPLLTWYRFHLMFQYLPSIVCLEQKNADWDILPMEKST